MKTEYIVTAKTVDEAYKKAVELYAPLGDISLEEVINPGKKGFLGIFGAVPAEIRISVDDGKEERKPKKKQKNESNKPQQQQQQQKQQKQKQPQQKKNEPKKEAPKQAQDTDAVKEKEDKIQMFKFQME